MNKGISIAFSGVLVVVIIFGIATLLNLPGNNSRKDIDQNQKTIAETEDYKKAMDALNKLKNLLETKEGCQGQAMTVMYSDSVRVCSTLGMIPDNCISLFDSQGNYLGKNVNNFELDAQTCLSKCYLSKELTDTINTSFTNRMSQCQSLPSKEENN